MAAVAAAIGAASSCGADGRAGGPVECIAPAAAGGGWDLTCRLVARELRAAGLIPGTMRVTNMPGAGGGVAFAHAVNRRAGNGRLLVAASPATTLRLAQDQFGGLSETDVRWLGTVGADVGVVAVRRGAGWPGLEDLLAAWRADPASIRVGGGSAVGGQDHMKALVLAEAAGLDPATVRYVPFDGGGEAITALLGGFLDVVPADASEVLAQVEAGNVTVLAVLAPDRLAGPLADVPTASELGYDVEWLIWRGFYLPPGVDDDAAAAWLERIDALARSDGWRETLRQYGLVPYYRAAEDFEAMVGREVARFRELSRRVGLIR